MSSTQVSLQVGSPSADWDAYVAANPAATIYHRSAWTLLARDVFNQQVYFAEARTEDGRLAGVLPLVRQRSLAFGDFLTSIAYFNYGGPCADSPGIAVQLMQACCELARQLGCKYFESRDTEPRNGEWQVRTDKVSMILQLPATFALLSQQLGAKLRSQAKRADREQASAVAGGSELLDEFYDVFCRNMRELGTPVYPRRFFAMLLERLPEECLLVVIRRGAQPVAAGFLVIAGARAEIPWAACRADAKPAGFNMRLYWEVLERAVSRGCSQFDFGRSTVDSGTYRFKKQWGARPLPLYWHRWLPAAHRARAAAAGDSKAMHYATQIWQHLPLRVANTLGPLVAPGLPW